jgi:Ca-activated chloride channel family protein
MSDWLGSFHFLRPIWLTIIPAALILYFIHDFREDIRSRWKNVIAAELLEHLIVKRTGGWKIRPIQMICAGLCLGSVAVAAPTWRREKPPFSEDKAPLVVAVDLSQTMNAIDLEPTRLERAKLKLHDLLKERNGGRTALFAYAGTAHMVIPLTTDAQLFELYLDALSTSLMPKGGKDTTDALRLIEEFLSHESVPGTILFVTDGIEQQAIAPLREFVEKGTDSVLVLGVGTSRGGPLRGPGDQFVTNSAGRREFSRVDMNALKSLSDLGVSATTLTLDDSDIQWIQRRTQNHLELAEEKSAQTRWVDEGYWLVFPIALLAVLWFRKGWTVQWGSGALAIFLLIPLPSAEGHRHRFLDLWLTGDQQGRYFFQKAQFAVAAERFEDPMWKGLSLGHAGDFSGAIDQFALTDSAEAWYNQGNALAHLQEFPEAVHAYKQALQRRPDWREAQENMELVRSLIPPKKKDDEEEMAPDEKPDQIQFDEKGKKGKKEQVARLEMDPEKMAEIWMRNIQTSPADFLRRRFAIQAHEGEKL